MEWWCTEQEAGRIEQGLSVFPLPKLKVGNVVIYPLKRINGCVWPVLICLQMPRESDFNQAHAFWFIVEIAL